MRCSSYLHRRLRIVPPAVGPESIRTASVFRTSLPAALMGAVLMVFPLSARGQESAETSNEPAKIKPSPAANELVAEAAKRAADQLDPERISVVDDAKDELLEARQDLIDFLDQGTSPEIAAAWIEYLEIDAVVEAIDSGASDKATAAKSVRVSHKATGIHPGLELDPIIRLRNAAKRYGNALRFRGRENTVKLLGIQLARFADRWAAIKSVPTPDETATLRLLLDLLDRTNQQIEFVDASLAQFSSANLHVNVSESLIRQAVGRDVSECKPVRDCILGTRIEGNALLTGKVDASLVPAEGRISMEILFDGTVSSSNRGYNGPVRLRSSGNGTARATRMVHITDSSVSLEPVQTTGYISTRINAIEHPMRLVRKIARKRAAEQKPRADRIANRKFVSRIGEEFRRETDSAVSDPLPGLTAKSRPFLKRMNLERPARSLGSTSESAYVIATVRQDYQLAAPIPPPPVELVHEVTVQVHESIVDNSIGAFLAGRTMSEGELKDLVRKIRPETDDASVSSESPSADEKTEFVIDFDDVRPVIFEAREGKLVVGVRGNRFAEGSRELKQRLEVVAIYEPVTNEAGIVVLQRVGDVEVNFPGRKRLGVAEAGLRPAIKRGFADAFPETLFDKPWMVPEDGNPAGLRGRNFRPRHFDAKDGWLTLGVSS